MPTYGALADAILGVGVRPFANGTGQPGWRGTQPNMWYRQSSFAKQHANLAEVLMAEGGEGKWVLEVGSFIGASAITWAKASQKAGVKATLVAMDTWLGDVGFWQKKGKWLGPPDATTGEPRIFEQFMSNVVAAGVDHIVLPCRASALVGLRYLSQLIANQKLSPPNTIYLDSAHEYPETVLELQAAWSVLGPGGYLIGDDFDRYWPSTQQSVLEFVQRLGTEAFEPATLFASSWPFRKVCRVATMVDARGANTNPAASPILLKNSQWILRKALVPARHQPAVDANSDAWPFWRKHFRCCLNRWADDNFTACRPPRTYLQQGTCNVYATTYSAASGDEGTLAGVRGVGRCKLFTCTSRRSSGER